MPFQFKKIFYEIYEDTPMWVKISIGITILFVLGLTACGVFKYQDDNVIEQLVEDYIDLKTGIKVDLSPSSPEKPDRWNK